MESVDRGRSLGLQQRSNHAVRLKVDLQGAVQGVGFRPFVYRLASELSLEGTIRNTGQGVRIELEGPQETLSRFLNRLPLEKPPRSSIYSLESVFLDRVGYQGLQILESLHGDPSAVVLPDIATCSDCLADIRDPGNRRYRYPFTNCTNCGPRFTIIECLPYDRQSTSMKNFEMCPDCREEYFNPSDRRFHAQPNACPACGPQLTLLDSHGQIVAERDEALLQAVQAIRSGAITAVKGLGGFHLIVDATNGEAVRTLRQRKHREEKPLAVLFPTLDLLRQHCRVGEVEERLFTSPESPIVLVPRLEKPARPLAEAVAPNNPYIGAMLPYTPLHHILMEDLGIPVVATSGNLSDEPICFGNDQALARLRGIADFLLLHDRPIIRHVDDSITRVIMGRELVMRRARGYAPLPIRLRDSSPSVLATGGQLKNSFALSHGSNVFISQHIGDLETLEARQAFLTGIEDLSALRKEAFTYVACDLHPDYASTRYALSLGKPVFPVQHHYAHVLSCATENQLEGSVLGVAWDGTGFGEDHTVWGGEFLLFDPAKPGFERKASFRRFLLPGGEAAVREPRRAALGILFELRPSLDFDDAPPAVEAFSAHELASICQMLIKGVNTPETSSVGRLFDAVASLIDLRHVNRFEGQAAMELEFCLPPSPSGEAYPFQIQRTGDGSLVIDWGPLIQELLEDVRRGKSRAEISSAFHHALSEIVVEVARDVSLPKVALSGGCFQNRYLVERTIRRLREEGFEPYWHQRVPPNDGGIALGQIAAAAVLLNGGPPKQGEVT